MILCGGRVWLLVFFVCTIQVSTSKIQIQGLIPIQYQCNSSTWYFPVLLCKISFSVLCGGSVRVHTHLSTLILIPYRFQSGTFNHHSITIQLSGMYLSRKLVGHTQFNLHNSLMGRPVLTYHVSPRTCPFPRSLRGRPITIPRTHSRA